MKQVVRRRRRATLLVKDRVPEMFLELKDKGKLACCAHGAHARIILTAITTAEIKVFFLPFNLFAGPESCGWARVHGVFRAHWHFVSCAQVLFKERYVFLIKSIKFLFLMILLLRSAK